MKFYEGKNKTYSLDDLRELVYYAQERGIQIIPEIDVPSHSLYKYIYLFINLFIYLLF